MGEKLSFESRYCLTTAMTKEYAKYVFCKTTRILGGIIMLVSVAALIISMVWAGYGLSDITLFILCFTAGLLIYNYYFLISMVVEKQAKRNGMKEPPECAVYFGSSIRMKEGKEEIAVKYPQIEKFYNLPNLFALETENKRTILVPKDSFVIGKAEDFEAFVKEKMQRQI